MSPDLGLYRAGFGPVFTEHGKIYHVADFGSKRSTSRHDFATCGIFSCVRKWPRRSPRVTLIHVSEKPRFLRVCERTCDNVASHPRNDCTGPLRAVVANAAATSTSRMKRKDTRIGISQGKRQCASRFQNGKSIPRKLDRNPSVPNKAPPGSPSHKSVARK